MLEDVNNFSEDDSPSLNELNVITPGGETVFECIQECMKSMIQIIAMKRIVMKMQKLYEFKCRMECS